MASVFTIFSIATTKEPKMMSEEQIEKAFEKWWQIKKQEYEHREFGKWEMVEPNRASREAFQSALKLLMPIIECQSKGLNEIVDKYFDLPVEARMQKGIKEGKESLIARHALKQVEEMLKEIGGRDG